MTSSTFSWFGVTAKVNEVAVAVAVALFAAAVARFQTEVVMAMPCAAWAAKAFITLYMSMET